MTLTEIAAKINAHLMRFEADKTINANAKGQPYYHAGCCRAGSYVQVKYVSYQGETNISRADALAYLAWLDAGNVGKHYAMPNKPAEAEDASAGTYVYRVVDGYGGNPELHRVAVQKETTERIRLCERTELSRYRVDVRPDQIQRSAREAWQHYVDSLILKQSSMRREVEALDGKIAAAKIEAAKA